jgi:hypothetical protein
MTLPRRQRRLLRSIGEQLSAADPQLARQLRRFGEFGGQEPLPVSEQLPAGVSRLRSVLWAALGASTWLIPEQHLAAGRAWPDPPRATFGPGVPAPGPGPGPWPQPPA